jgi:hypothetical protein
MFKTDREWSRFIYGISYGFMVTIMLDTAFNMNAPLIVTIVWSIIFLYYVWLTRLQKPND